MILGKPCFIFKGRGKDFIFGILTFTKSSYSSLIYVFSKINVSHNSAVDTLLIYIINDIRSVFFQPITFSILCVLTTK